MINIKKIKELYDINELNLSEYDYIFHGMSIDQRTEVMLDKVNTENLHGAKYVYYDKEKRSLVIGDDSIVVLRLTSYFSALNACSIFIDATSLDLPEIIYILTGIQQAQLECDIRISYIEPEDYQRNSDDSVPNGVQEQEFKLSDSQEQFSYLPLFAINHAQTEKSTLITTLGFECSRLGQLLEEDDGFAYENVEAYVGLPAYKPGWENRALYKHTKYLADNNAELKMFPACNPYQLIRDLEPRVRGNRTPKLVFAPLGTKPSIIAISLFLVNQRIERDMNAQLGVLHDFPVKASGRSRGVGKTYLYELQASYASC